MNTHDRSIQASIDPVKLDRLAEVAVKVGLRLERGQNLFLTAPAAALPLDSKSARQAVSNSFLMDPLPEPALAEN